MVLVAYIFGETPREILEQLCKDIEKAVTGVGTGLIGIDAATFKLTLSAETGSRLAQAEVWLGKNVPVGQGFERVVRGPK